MTATLKRVGRKKSEHPTAVTRIHRDLLEMAELVALVRGVDVADLLSQILRPELNELYPQAIETLQKRKKDLGLK